MIFLRAAVQVMGEPYPRRCCDVLQKQLHMILTQSSALGSSVDGNPWVGLLGVFIIEGCCGKWPGESLL